MSSPMKWTLPQKSPNHVITKNVDFSTQSLARAAESMDLSLDHSPKPTKWKQKTIVKEKNVLSNPGIWAPLVAPW